MLGFAYDPARQGRRNRRLTHIPPGGPGCGGKNALVECHRRYLLQQAYEKGMKALGLVLWDERTPDITSFNRFFLHRHDPSLD